MTTAASGRVFLATFLAILFLLVPSCRTAGGHPGGTVPPPRAPLVLEVLDRYRVPPGREWRIEDRADELLDAAVLARTGADYPLDGWASLAPGGTVTVVAVPGLDRPLVRAVAARFSLALGRVRLVAPPAEWGEPTPWVLVASPTLDRDGTVRDDGTAVARQLREEGWPAPALVLADLVRPLVAGEPWDAREILVGTRPEAVAAVAGWQLRGRREEILPPPEEAPRVRLAVLPVGD